MLTTAMDFLVSFFQLFDSFKVLYNKKLGFKKNERLTAEKGKVLK